MWSYCDQLSNSFFYLPLLNAKEIPCGQDKVKNRPNGNQEKFKLLWSLQALLVRFKNTYLWVNIFAKKYKWLFSGSCVIFLGYYAVRIIPLDDAIAIIFASPIFSILFEWSLVRKSQGIFYKLGFSLVLIAGVILVLQPPFLHFHQENQVDYSTSEYLGMGIITCHSIRILRIRF